MQDALDALLFPEALTAAQRQALQEVLAEDEALAEAYGHWLQVRDAVRSDLNKQVPDRRLLVLHALAVSGQGEELTSTEQAELDAARPHLLATINQYPALADVVHHIQDGCADFDACWNEHFAEAPAAPRADSLRPAADRRAQQRSPVRTASQWGWRVMAPLAVALFMITALLIFQRDSQMVTLEVAEGQTQVVELADGSTVRLLGGARLVYTDPDDAATFNRRVELTGQAFFDVVPGQQGFSVATPTGVTTVLGTSFGISADDAEMQVVLATGKVAVASHAAPDRVVVLEPGQMSEVARNALPSTPTEVELSEALGWTGLFVFRATSLADAAALLSERYGVPVSVDAALAQEAVNGTFEQEVGAQQILEWLAPTVNAQVQATADGGFVLVP